MPPKKNLHLQAVAAEVVAAAVVVVAEAAIAATVVTAETAVAVVISESIKVRREGS